MSASARACRPCGWAWAGDAVNTAARLEGLTKEAGVPVLISAETVARLHAPALWELPAMRLRGKDEAVRVFTLP